MLDQWVFLLYKTFDFNIGSISAVLAFKKLVCSVDFENIEVEEVQLERERVDVLCDLFIRW